MKYEFILIKVMLNQIKQDKVQTAIPLSSSFKVRSATPFICLPKELYGSPCEQMQSCLETKANLFYDDWHLPVTINNDQYTSLCQTCFP